MPAILLACKYLVACLHADQHHDAFQVACKQHRDSGHVDVMHRRCGAQGCSRAPSFSSVIQHTCPHPHDSQRARTEANVLIHAYLSTSDDDLPSLLRKCDASTKDRERVSPSQHLASLPCLSRTPLFSQLGSLYLAFFYLVCVSILLSMPI